MECFHRNKRKRLHDNRALELLLFSRWLTSFLSFSLLFSVWITSSLCTESQMSVFCGSLMPQASQERRSNTVACRSSFAASPLTWDSRLCHSHNENWKPPCRLGRKPWIICKSVVLKKYIWFTLVWCQICHSCIENKSISISVLWSTACVEFASSRVRHKCRALVERSKKPIWCLECWGSVVPPTHW